MLKLLRFLNPPQTSFRSILLWRILLLTIPVLCLLQYATYRKARSSFLETARYNLTESAIEKADRLEISIYALTNQLRTASETSALQSSDPSEINLYLNQLIQRFSTPVVCMQLHNLSQQKTIASTCGNEAIANFKAQNISEKPSPQSSSRVKVEVLFPSTSSDSENSRTGKDQLHFLMSTPVDQTSSQQQYTLVVETLLSLEQTQDPKSLSGYTVIIDQDGQIVAHIDSSRIGTYIHNEKNENLKARLNAIMRDATSGQNDFLHLTSFDQSGKEAIAGYTAISNPTATNLTHSNWVVLAVTPLDDALSGLEKIRQTLINLVLGLIAANLIATFILARSLVTPVEQLGKYAQSVEWSVSPQPIPQQFKISEFNQLAKTLNGMVQRLISWAEELEMAWQEAKSANQLKSEFLTTISHDLRTPLNGIIGSVRLVKDGFCDDREEELEFLEKVDSSALLLKSIIDDILDVSKIEEGGLSLELAPLNLNDVLQTAIDTHINDAKNKGLYITYKNKNTKLSSLDPIPVQGDLEKLTKVFLNIISNSVKFTQEGGITIDVQIDDIQTDDIQSSLAGAKDSSDVENLAKKQVVISITDTGIGIDPASQSKLFQPFVLVDGSRTRKFGGAGLGLVISRSLIEMMGGTISLSSEGKDRGTTVIIMLPMIDVKQLEELQVLK